MKKLFKELLDKVNVDDKEEIRKEIENRHSNSLKIYKNNLIRHEIENKIDLLVNATTVQEKEKIAKELKTLIDLLVKTSDVIDNKTKQIEEFKKQQADLENQAEIKEITEKINTLNDEKEKIAANLNEEEAKLTQEIEELTNKMNENNTKAEGSIAAVDKQIEELTAQKGALKESKEKELAENITKLENEIKQTKADLTAKIKGEESKAEIKPNTEEDGTTETIETTGNNNETTTENKE